MTCEECERWRYFWHLDKEYPFTTERSYNCARLKVMEESNSTKVGICIDRMKITGNKSCCQEV